MPTLLQPWFTQPAMPEVHFHSQVAKNDLTIDATDPKSGTAKFKATAIRIEKCRED